MTSVEEAKKLGLGKKISSVASIGKKASSVIKKGIKGN